MKSPRLYRTARGLLGALAGMLFAHVAVAADMHEKESIWKLVVVGIPLGVLAASMAASAVRSLKEPSQPDQKIPAKVFSIVFDGLAGGWTAMFLTGFTLTRGYISDVLPAVIGALCALLMQWLRDHWKPYFDQAFQAFLAWLRGWRTPDKPAGGEP